jgi:hypothetical protein
MPRKAKASDESVDTTTTTAAIKPTRKQKTVKKEKEKEIEKEEGVVTVVTGLRQEEHIILQLAIPEERVRSILKDTSEMLNPLEYCHTIIDPEPYIPTSHFMSHNDPITHTKPDPGNKQLIETPTQKMTDDNNVVANNNCCYWCCHSIGTRTFGLPIKYDTIHDSFTTFGQFCSLECVTAHNYSYYMGSDRMWEIHSWIQWMAHKMGYDTPIRPAPSRFLLKMFNGPLEIAEFRETHKNYMKTYIMNMPPLIHVQGQMEIINTSYLNQKTTITTTSAATELQEKDRVKLSRNKGVVDIRKTLDSKMNLIIKSQVVINK